LITRFAPAPTGWLHLGHVLNAEYVWKRAEALSGRVLLRIEDHDRSRSREVFEAGILDDLDWLGYRPDIFPTDAYRAGRCDGRQSDRDHIYREAFDLLREQGLVYACECSRRVAGIAAQVTSLPTGEPAELRYHGLCRDKRLPLSEGFGWRVRMAPGIEEFHDERLGLQRQNPEEQCGDVLLRDRHGNWTYQFAVTVDDWRQGVDYVIRGIDLLASTGRQIRIARLLGRAQPPTFLHHSLIMKTPEQKLCKSDGDTGVRDLRARGWLAKEVIRAATEFLAFPQHLCGIDPRRPAGR
jgi:glutamyl-Q tRNA(Asp) synthetase